MISTFEAETYTLEDYKEAQSALIEEIATIKATNPHFNFDETGDSYYAQLYQELMRVRRHLSIAYLFRVDLPQQIAREVKNAFGPCTGVYEAMTDNEIIQSLREAKSLNDWVKRKCSVEDDSGEVAQRLRQFFLLDEAALHEQQSEDCASDEWVEGLPF